MNSIGKSIRMERIFDRNTGNAIIIPMDHGVGAGPIKGLENLQDAVNLVAEGGANAVLGHMGLAK
ncbi:MAG: fructose-bisphosphate aldolase, partial [Methanosarcinaceae archaeon]|nr:fructose-bisphosphate aldolase [Methanosarcinaceae archaeon]